MTKADKPKQNFDAALAELNDIVESLEKGDLNLEDALKKFEQGIKLTQYCQKALKQAQQKVQQLVEKGDDVILEDFQTDLGSDGSVGSDG